MKTLFLLSLFAGIFAAGSAMAGEKHELGLTGDEKNNAAELVKGEARIAWFRDRNRVIRYCGENGPDHYYKFDGFAYGSPTYIWEEYLIAHKIAEKKDLAYRFELMDKCDGTEDLAIYFGVPRTDPRIAKYIPESSSLLAYAVKTEEEPGGKWAKGFIWTAPLADRTFDLGNGKQLTFHKEQHFSKIQTFQQILATHELGHALGNSHLAGTIMDEDIALISMLEYYEEGVEWNGRPYWIDRTRKLYNSVDDAPMGHGGYLGNEDFVAEKFGAHLAGQVPGDEELFTRLMGFKPYFPYEEKDKEGYIPFWSTNRVRRLGLFLLLEINPEQVPYSVPTNDELMRDYDLDILDPEDNTLYFFMPLTPTSGAKTQLSRGTEIFRTDPRPIEARLKDPASWSKNQLSDTLFSDGYVMDYDLKLPSGKKMPVRIYRNTPLVLEDNKFTKILNSPFILQEKATGKVIFIDSQFEYFAQPK